MISILKICFLFGIIILCVILICWAVLKWLKQPIEEPKPDGSTLSGKGIPLEKAKILAGLALTVLFVMLVVGYEAKTSDGKDNERGTSGIITSQEAPDGESSGDETEQKKQNDESNYDGTKQEGSNDENVQPKSIYSKALRTILVVMLFGVMVMSIVATLLIVVKGMVSTISRILLWKAEKNGTANKKNEVFFGVMKSESNTVALIFACALVALFLFLPFLVGDQAGNQSMEIWEKGMRTMGRMMEPQVVGNASSVVRSLSDTETDLDTETVSDSSLFKALATYTLIYIVLLGVGFAVVKILSSIIRRALKKSEKGDLIEEYASPIALLSVGIAVLILIQQGDFPRESRIETIVELVKSFATVTVIAAIVILTLEIIRLLMDVREGLIRRESRFLFISLVGQSALLLLTVFNSICNAIGSAIGGTMNNRVEAINKKLMNKMIEVMEEEIDFKKRKSHQTQSNHKNDHRTTFCPFDGKVTKK